MLLDVKDFDYNFNELSYKTNLSIIRDFFNSVNSNLRELKQYTNGNKYNGVTIAVSGTNWTTDYAVFVPYQTHATSLGDDAVWRLKFNIGGVISVKAATLTLTVTGITSKNNPTYDQAVVAILNSSGVAERFSRAEWSNNSSNIIITEVGANTFDEVAVSGDIELASKPTFAD